MTNPKEIWRPVPGYEGIYEVSNYGRVRSLDKYRTIKGTRRKYKGKILKTYGHLNSPPQTIMLVHNNVRRNWTISHLVLKAFGSDSSIYSKNCVVGYRDGDKTNLYIGNLYVKRGCHSENYGLSIEYGHWRVSMNIAGKSRYFGLYKTKEQAKNVRDTVREIYKETGKIVYPQKCSIHTRRAYGTGCVTFSKKEKKWLAKITENKKTHYLGGFPTKEEAEAALDEYIAKKKKE
jgi:hypothetical protein